MAEKKRGSFAPPALGGSSLLVAFAVLALTVFALLSLSTVRADVRLGDAAAESVKAYYAADAKAQEILARLRSGEMPENVEIKEWGVASYTVPISDTQELQVEVRLDRLLLDMETDTYTVLRWAEVATGDWDYDDGLDVWDGEMILF